ncbi:MAG: glycosyltransferase family 2 protein [Clostridia bacterium]|nr:glycosyltransferase family 2 protein [Clostridia bacterium]
MPKVSIIVPIYKVESYLKRCVDSLRNQTLKDIEIILVDDGSPDNCPQMCDEFAKQDHRIKVVHKQNGGLSSARNAGIDISTGEYLGYIDSDDYAEPYMFEKLYNCAVANKVDFVMADYYRVSNGQKKEKSLDIREGFYTKEDIVKEIYPMLIMRESIGFGPLLSVWNCLYKADFIKNNNLYFDEEVKWSEDCIYSAILGYLANSFYYLKGECVYNYIQNSGSISTTYQHRAWAVYCLMNHKLRDFFEGKNDFDFSRQLDLHILYFACSLCGELEYTNFSFWQKYKVKKSVLNTPCFKNVMKGFKLPNVNIKFKIVLWLMKKKQAFLLTLLK